LKKTTIDISGLTGYILKRNYHFKLTNEGYKFLNWLHVHNNNKQKATIN